MGESASGLEEMIAELRRMLPAQSDTAQAIDDGYIEFSHQFTQFIETCLRRGA